ncbi:uncharacterized protein LOC142322906 [Lycorma delicatula]|uniref:uncharacterized protein LOC142322906 n=1 Tax=Lycorma delicatula TaxID=130591 RepID=UPI003F50E3D3
MDSQKQYKHLPNTDEKASAFSDFGDQPFCLSAPKMAMSFATLGMVFLAAVAISLYVLLRNRLQRKAHRRFTGFDVTSEQNLLVIRDSPSFSRTISVWSYGR